jgi:signal transduction histidine kinase
VKLLQISDQAQITIADDGRGFDATNRAEKDRGLGLVSISERARIIGGTVSVVSGLQLGTRVQATIPMTARVKVDVGAGMAGQVA